MRVILKAVFILSLLFLTRSLFSETCAIGVDQYRPSGTCSTESRKCCKSGSSTFWGNWGESCPAQRCSQEFCLDKGVSIGYSGLVWNGIEYWEDSKPCCSDACNVPEYENTCHCFSYASTHLCECYGFAPYYIANNSYDKEKLCSCDPGIYWNTYISNNKKECCSVLKGSWDGRNCRATVYEWQIVNNNEMWINGYSCPSPDIIGSICNSVLNNSYYFTNPTIDNLPVCDGSCTSSQEGSKCKYCEIVYDRACAGYPSGGGPDAVKKTKTCVRTQKVL